MHIVWYHPSLKIWSVYPIDVSAIGNFFNARVLQQPTKEYENQILMRTISRRPGHKTEEDMQNFCFLCLVLLVSVYDNYIVYGEHICKRNSSMVVYLAEYFIPYLVRIVYRVTVIQQI